MKLNWNFQKGGGFLAKFPSVGEVWIFSGITQSIPRVTSHFANDQFANLELQNTGPLFPLTRISIIPHSVFPSRAKQAAKYVNATH